MRRNKPKCPSLSSHVHDKSFLVIIQNRVQDNLTTCPLSQVLGRSRFTEKLLERPLDARWLLILFLDLSPASLFVSCFAAGVLRVHSDVLGRSSLRFLVSSSVLLPVPLPIFVSRWFRGRLITWATRGSRARLISGWVGAPMPC